MFTHISVQSSMVEVYFGGKEFASHFVANSEYKGDYFNDFY